MPLLAIVAGIVLIVGVVWYATFVLIQSHRDTVAMKRFEAKMRQRLAGGRWQDDTPPPYEENKS